jgi:hypothetical protein
MSYWNSQTAIQVHPAATYFLQVGERLTYWVGDLKVVAEFVPGETSLRRWPISWIW